MSKRKTLATLPNGKQIEVFSIGTLAFRMGRTVNSIRRWEIMGVIPPTCFFDSQGCRMYSLEQINLLVNTATECKIAQGRPITRTSFPKKIFERWQPLIDKYLSVEDKHHENEK